MNFINPFNNKYSLSFFISKEEYLNKINILFGGYYNYFKKAFIIDTEELIINKNNNINKLFVYPNDNNFYNYIKLFIGKFYYLTFNNFHKFIINNVEINIFYDFEPFNSLIKKHSILCNDNLLLYPTQYLNLQTKDYLLSPDINYAKLLYSKIIKNEINNDLINQLNINYFKILFKLVLFKKNYNIINLLKNNNKIYECADILENIMNKDFNLFKTFNNYNKFLDNNGFNLLEYAIINKNVDAILFLKNFKFDRSSYYIEISYNTKYLKYNEDDKLIKIENIPKQIKNCKFLNTLIIDEMLNHGLFDKTYDYIVHHLKYFDFSLLCDMLIRNHSSLTVKLMLKNNILEINKYSLKLLIKLQLENLYDKQQKEIFLNNLEYILNLMINDEKIWLRFKEKKYLNLLNINFIINNNYDNILHLLIKNNYKSFHDDIFNYIIKINDKIINNVNKQNENCIFELNNKQLINKIFIYGVDNIQNVYGDYFIHKIIRNNNFNLLFSTLSINNQMLNLQNTYNETPIILAARLKLNKIVNYLHKMNCNMDLIDCFGNSCYHYIMMFGYKVDFEINKNISNQFNYKSTDYLINCIINE